MKPAYRDHFQQMDDLCCQLLLLVQGARRSEREGNGGILAYGFISACASMIQTTAEERRQALALGQYEGLHESFKVKLCLEMKA